jgi:NAD(P)-dependent dehydrogenase (short-subunit alcohol dehydrogenase family)
MPILSSQLGRGAGAATARRVDDLQDLKDRYRDQVLLLPLDVTTETQAIEAVMSTIRTFGRLDVLVNNAVYGNVAPVEDTTLEECRAIVLSRSLPPNLLWLRRMRRGGTLRLSNFTRLNMRISQ